MSKWQSTQTPGVRFRQTAAGRTYYIDFIDGAGKRRQERVDGNYDDAKATLGKIRGSTADGRPAPQRVTVRYSEYAESVITRRESRGLISEDSARLYRGHLKHSVLPLIGRKPLKDVTKHDILRVVDAARARGLSGWTVNSVIGVMSQVGTEANWDFELPNPVSELKAEHRPKKLGSATKMHVFTSDERNKMLAVADNVVALLIALAFGTGLRQSELLGLRWGDFDLRDIPTVTCHGQLRRRGKGWKNQIKSKEAGVTRTVEFARDVATLIRTRRLEAVSSQDDDYVFTNPETGQPFQQAWAYKVFVKARDKAGVQAAVEKKDRATFHDMRDTFASMLIAGSANIVEVQDALGHEKASTTLDHYAHLWDAQKRRGKLRDILEAAV